MIGDIPNHYDNSGSCKSGEFIATGKLCSDYSAGLTFETSDKTGRFYPVIIRITGTREGTSISQTFTTRFDEKLSTYRAIEGLPEEFANGL